MAKDIWIDRWLILPPKETSDENGDRVLISMKSFGPLEIWEWGIGSDGTPFMRYAWLENDYYADDNRRKAIPPAELDEKLLFLAKQLHEHGYTELAKRYDAICAARNAGN